MEFSVLDYENECATAPYLQLIREKPNPKEITKKGSAWTTIFHLLFGDWKKKNGKEVLEWN